MKCIRAIDLFCGAGGSSWGARAAGATIVAGFDLWDQAGKVYQDNFPEASFHLGRLEDHPDSIIKGLGKIDLLLASPECTNHSPAKGNKPRCEKSKETAFQVTRFAKLLAPRWIVIENVVSMRNWTRYREFLDELEEQGYHVNAQVLTASDFGVPQRRRRLFVLCDQKRKPDDVEPTRQAEAPARRVVDMNGTHKWNPLRTETRAKATLARAERAMSEVGKKEPFLIVYYGSDHAGGWQSLDQPLRTITTLDRFAIVKPTSNGHVMRMLQVPELRKAMGMPVKFRFEQSTRRNHIKMLGNAVCTPVMAAVLEKLITNA